MKICKDCCSDNVDVQLYPNAIYYNNVCLNCGFSWRTKVIIQGE